MPNLLMSLYLVTRELSHFYAVALRFGFAYGGVMPLDAILMREYFGAVGLASTRPPRSLPAARPTPSVAH